MSLPQYSLRNLGETPCEANRETNFVIIHTALLSTDYTNFILTWEQNEDIKRISPSRKWKETEKIIE